jgi:arsenate reductase-like glutaredoxin family protein
MLTQNLTIHNNVVCNAKKNRMNIKKQFHYDPAVEVSASQIGISKWDWISTTSSEENIAVEIMRKNRFDVLPIENADGTFNSYFSTQEWNVYSSLNKNKINDAQTIYYRLSLKDLIRKFKNDDRHYYFLTDYDEILGLVSYVNLNCQLVYNYLFFIIADIERSVSGILKDYVSQDKILALFEQSDDKHLFELYETFQKNIKDNNDNDIFQHMYLQTVGITLKKFLNELPNEYKGLNKFSSKFGTEGVYNLVRQKVMHPVRPILSDKKSINQIDELLNDYIEIKNIAESTTHNNV